MVRRESDLYPPVRDWLRARGWEVHCEMFGCDVVAVKDGVLLAVELKLCLTRTLWFQGIHATGWADRVYLAVGTETRTQYAFRSYGIGLLTITNGKVRERRKPLPQPWGFHRRRQYRLKKLAGRPEAMDHELAGLPCSPALREQRLLRNAKLAVGTQLSTNAQEQNT